MGPDVDGKCEEGIFAENGEANERSARTTRFKLVQAPRPSGGIERRLYDLEADPGETTDVSSLHPEILKSLSRKLDGWLKAFK